MDEEVVIIRAPGPESDPFPAPELAIGNIVRLKKPYTNEGNGYQWGIIVEHISRNAWGIPKLSLHLFNDDGQLLYDEDSNHIPSYYDCVASELILWKVAGTAGFGYDPVCGDGFDMYPKCPGCQDIDQHPFADEKCPQCGGWGHVREMQRLNESKGDLPRSPESKG